MLPVARGAFDVTRDHWWWRGGWGPGTRYLTWHLTFDGADALHAASRRFAASVAAVRNVDAVPVEWLHLTMSGVGFAGDVADDAVAEMVREIVAAADDLDAPPLEFASAGLYREGVSLGADAPWLQRLKAVQVDAIARAGGVIPAAGEVFHPHVSLAYFAGEVDEEAVTAAVAGLDPVTVASPTLALIELGRDDRVYTWRTLAATRLGG